MTGLLVSPARLQPHYSGRAHEIHISPPRTVPTAYEPRTARASARSATRTTGRLFIIVLFKHEERERREVGALAQIPHDSHTVKPYFRLAPLEDEIGRGGTLRGRPAAECVEPYDQLHVIRQADIPVSAGEIDVVARRRPAVRAARTFGRPTVRPYPLPDLHYRDSTVLVRGHHTDPF